MTLKVFPMISLATGVVNIVLVWMALYTITGNSQLEKISTYNINLIKAKSDNTVYSKL